MKTFWTRCRLIYFVVPAALILGMLTGKVMFSSAPDVIYTTSRPVFLLDKDGNNLGQLPIGTPIVSTLRLDPNGELGWWGSVPVYFGTSSEASDLLQRSRLKVSNVNEAITLNGVKQSEVPKNVD